MTGPADDDLPAFLRGFHSQALAAYMTVAAETDQWPPDSETVRQRAYDLYERELRTEITEQPQPPQPPYFETPPSASG